MKGKLISMTESDSFDSHFLLELECPICTNYMNPSIRMCETGHSICEPCMKKLPRCPSCQKNFINAKNITLQSLAEKVRYPCTNQSLGCDEKLKLEKKQEHEENCSFRRYKCAMENCTWIGQLEDIPNHWQSKPRMIFSADSEAETGFCLNVTNDITDNYHVRLITACDELFWLKRIMKNGIIYWVVQLIGPAAKAGNYYYKIDICKPLNNKCTIILKDYCKSIEIENTDLFKKGDCLTTISNDSREYFIQNYKFPTYSVKIYKC